MEKKWKAFIMKYRDFCIAAGIVGFLLGPFLWPFFLAIILNTLSLTVPILLVYSLIKQPWKKKGTEDGNKDKKAQSESCKKDTKKPHDFSQHSKKEPKESEKRPTPSQTAEHEAKKADEQLTPQEKTKTVPGENPLGKGTEHRKNKTVKVPQEVEDWYELTGKNRILHISRSLLNKRVFSFSIAQDGMCSMKSKEGFARVAAIRDFPGKEIKALCAIINREGEIQAKVNGKYLWISRRRRQP